LAGVRPVENSNDDIPVQTKEGTNSEKEINNKAFEDAYIEASIPSTRDVISN